MLRPDFPLATERLLLRPFRENDLDDFLAYRSLDSVTRYVPWNVVNRNGARELLKDMATRTALFDEGTRLVVAVELNRTVIGEVVLFWRSREHRQGEVGYVFHPKYGKHGYATEATREMLRLGFEELRLHRIYGRIDARNDASARVLRRLGMRQEAHFHHNELVRGEWTDEIVYAVLRDEWTVGATQQDQPVHR